MDVRGIGSADPDMHIYHYAPYEPTALKRLMGATARGRRGRRAAPRPSASSTSTASSPQVRAHRWRVVLASRRSSSSTVQRATSWLATRRRASSPSRRGSTRRGEARSERLERIEATTTTTARVHAAARRLEAKRVELESANGVVVPRPFAVKVRGRAQANAAQAVVAALAERLMRARPRRTNGPRKQHASLAAGPPAAVAPARGEARWWEYFHLEYDLRDDGARSRAIELAGLDVRREVGTRRSRGLPLPVPAPGPQVHGRRSSTTRRPEERRRGRGSTTRWHLDLKRSRRLSPTPPR